MENHHGGHSRRDDADAFIPDPEGGPIPADDDLEGELLEDYMRTATTGDSAGEDMRAEELVEELGGPFVTTTAGVELAYDDGDEEIVPRRPHRKAAQPAI